MSKKRTIQTTMAAFKRDPFFIIWLLLVAASPESSAQSNPQVIKAESNKDSYFIETYFKANWFKANQFCKIHGMDLLYFNNEKEFDDLARQLRVANYTFHFWTSGNELVEEKSWFWMSTGHSLSFTRWGDKEPSRKDNKEHCIELWGDEKKLFLWNDENCGSDRYFICRKKNQNEA